MQNEVFEQIIQHGADGTLDCFFDILAWSFTSLFAGVFPDRDWTGAIYDPLSEAGRKAGKALAGNFCGALISLEGDLEYFAASLKLPRWSVLEGPCPMCACKGYGPTTWKSFTADAHWKDLVWSPQAWHLWSGKSTCKIFKVPRLSALNASLDYMHAKYLGSDQYQYGGIFFLLCFHILPLAPLSNLKTVWQRMQQLYQDLGIVERYRYFNRITMFKKQSGAVKLRGKAAEVKNVGLVVLNLWQQYHNGAVEVHRMVLAMLKMNAKMESILADHKHENHFSPMAAEQFQAAAFQMGHLNHLIANRFEKEAGVPNVCNMTAKLHMVMHCAQYSGALNPRLVWCFSGEDYMHFMKNFGPAVLQRPSAPGCLH